MAVTRFSGVDNSSLAWATVAPAAGDLVLVLFSNDGGDAQSGLTDFTRINSNTSTQTGVELGVYYRICTGSESGDIFTSEASFGVTGEEYAWHAFKIPIAEWHGTTPPEISAIATASTGTPNPNSLDPSWGAESNTIFFVVLCRDDDDGIPDAPTNYSTNFARTAGGTSGPEIATSWRIPSPAISSEDPGNWSVTGTSEEYITHTIAVRPTSGPIITSIDTDDDTVDTRTGVDIAGTNFGASETGSAKVEISNNATYGSGTVVEVDVTSWSSTSITVTLLQESDSAALSTLLSLPLSPAYLWVTNSSGSRNLIGHQFTLRPIGPTSVDDPNTSVLLEVDTTFLARVRIENTGGTGSTAFKWQYNLNSVGWNDITTTSDVVQAVAGASFADNDDVPEVIGGTGSYISNNDSASEDGSFTLPAGFAALAAVEAVLAFQIVGDDVDDEDVIQLRIIENDGTLLDSYTNTPSITVDKESEVVTNTITSSLEALAQKQNNLVSASLVASGQKTLSITSSLDSLSSLLRTVVSDLDSISKSTLTSTVALEAAGLTTRTGAFDLDALAQVSQSIAADLDSVSRAALTIQSTLSAVSRRELSVSVSLEALAQASAVITSTLNSVASKLFTISIALDAVGVEIGVNSITATFDSVSKAIIQLVASLSAAGQTGFSIDSTLDAASRDTLNITAQLSVLSRALKTVQASLDSASRSSLTISITLDAIGQSLGATEIFAVLDALSQSSSSILATLDSISQISRSITSTLDARAVVLNAISSALDSLGQRTVSLVSSLDSMAQRAFAISTVFDSMAQLARQEVVDLDAVGSLVRDITSLFDSVSRKQNIVTALLDAVGGAVVPPGLSGPTSASGSSGVSSAAGASGESFASGSSGFSTASRSRGSSQSTGSSGATEAKK